MLQVARVYFRLVVRVCFRLLECISGWLLSECVTSIFQVGCQSVFQIARVYFRLVVIRVCFRLPECQSVCISDWLPEESRETAPAHVIAMACHVQ